VGTVAESDSAWLRLAAPISLPALRMPGPVDVLAPDSLSERWWFPFCSQPLGFGWPRSAATDFKIHQ
jgi:hypothetical protein